MKMGKWGACVLALLALAKMAKAEPLNLHLASSGYVYFNRPGADLATHNADLAACAAAVPFEVDPNAGDSPIHAGLLLYDGFIAAGAADVENCMVTRGWRVVRLSNVEGIEVSALPLADLVARMTPWIGAATPEGSLARMWNNDAIRASSFTPVDARFFHDGQLSWKINNDLKNRPAKGQSGPPRELVSFPLYFKRGKIDSRWPAKIGQSVNLANISKAPAGSALIVLRVVNISIPKHRTLAISRLGPNGEDIPSLQDHDPDFFAFLENRYKTDWFIEAVPPGRWRINTLGISVLCLGAPAFDVKAGDVIYAGTIDMASENRTPDLALEPVKAFLAGTTAADTVKPADYYNGSVSKCGLDMYAFEIPGAPFLPGYTWGSLAATPPLSPPDGKDSSTVQGQ